MYIYCRRNPYLVVSTTKYNAKVFILIWCSESVCLSLWISLSTLLLSVMGLVLKQIFLSTFNKFLYKDFHDIFREIILQVSSH